MRALTGNTLVPRTPQHQPLLFLDVDGPLNPYAAQPEQCPKGFITLRVGERPGTRQPPHLWLNPDHGQSLLRLGFELCWATTWMEEANHWIGPALGLPQLPWVDFGDSLLRERPDGVHWKTEPLLRYANGRPFAWVDDEQSDLDHAYVAAHHPSPALLHHVNPRIGLRQDDFLALLTFARSHKCTVSGRAYTHTHLEPRPAHRVGSCTG
ncbi:hypothetical protein [Streptomyces orinoci]|uniref:Secreted protein n=1 Tax=Streptomyces orinoci TaxID=67339 RepID=A0ABV3K4B2_STRON|nr:hypothetical protein [Streptomyces orinoci]